MGNEFNFPQNKNAKLNIQQQQYQQKLQPVAPQGQIVVNTQQQPPKQNDKVLGNTQNQPQTQPQPEKNNNQVGKENIKDNNLGKGNPQVNSQRQNMTENHQTNPHGNPQGIPQNNIQGNNQIKAMENPQTNPQVNTQVNNQKKVEINSQLNKKEKAKNEKAKKIKFEKIIKPKIPPKGLNNIGATCYMNSVIQCLYHSYELSNGLLNIYEQTPKKEKNIFEKIPMTLAFLGTVSGLTNSSKQSINPTKFKEIIGNNKLFRNFEANDSKTLTLYVLDTLNKELNEFYNNKNLLSENDILNYKEKDAESIVQLFKENYNSLIGELFHGLKKSVYKCVVCKNSVNTYQIFNIITCPVEKIYNEFYNKKELRINIMDCFKLEEKQKLFIENNQLYCEKCNKVNDGVCDNKIIFSPKMLILFLDRGENNKFECEVDFSEELDINTYVENKEKNNKYELIGVIEHLGQSGPSGHFIANCKHFDKNWYIFSDSSIYDEGKVYKKYGIPYLLFYRRKD